MVEEDSADKLHLRIQWFSLGRCREGAMVLRPDDSVEGAVVHSQHR